MNLSQLSKEYQSNGAVKVPALVSRAWATQLREPVEELISLASKTNEPFFKLDDVEIRQTDGGRVTIRWMTRKYPKVRAFFSERKPLEAVGTIIGADSLRLLFDLTFVHLPGFVAPSGSPWHHDIAVFPFSGEQMPSFWVALTDISPDMSRMQCLKGTHKDPVLYRPPVYVDQQTTLPPGFAELPDFGSLVEQGKYEVLEWPEMKAGDALLIHPATVHRALGNTSADGCRIAFTSRLMGGDARWRPTPFSMDMPGIDYAEVEPGTPVCHPLFPTVWER